MQRSNTNVFIEGFLNQYVASMVSDIPDLIKNEYKSFPDMNIEKDVADIVSDNLIKIANNSNVSFDFVKIADSKDIDKIKKKKKYQFEIMIKNMENEYSEALNGRFSTNISSPFNSIILNTLAATGLKTSEIIEANYKNVHDWSERYLSKDSFDIAKSGVQNFVGLSSYPYFYLIKSSEPKRAIKYLLVDLTECVFRLSRTDKYRHFVDYYPNSFGKGFYSDISRPVQKESKQDEFALITERQLKETFFNDEKGTVNQVQIITNRSWDYRDWNIFSFLCTKCIKENLGNLDVLSAEGTVYEICCVMFPEVKGRNFSSKHYEAAKIHLRNLFNTQLTAKVDGKEVIKTIFDNAYIDDPDERGIHSEETSSYEGKTKGGAIFKAEFGRRITGDILSSRLETIIRPQIDELDSVVSKMLYTQMKKDRTTDLFLAQRTLHTYSLLSLMLIIRLGDAKKKRIEKYKAAIDDMINKGILIKKCRVIGDDFEIAWLPLSDEEKSDIKIIPSVNMIE